jgi:hypothetical protein
LPARMAFLDRTAACSSTFRMYLRPCKVHKADQSFSTTLKPDAD